MTSSSGPTCGTAKSPPLRHPNTPCDQHGRPVKIRWDVRGMVAFSYPGRPPKPPGVYLGELHADGVVRSAVLSTSLEAGKILRRLRRKK